MDILSEIEPRDAQAAAVQGLQVAQRLRLQQFAERERLTRYGQVLSGLIGQLQEHASGGSAFMQLAGRVQKSRPEAKCRGDPMSIANVRPKSLKLGFDLGRRCQIGLQRHEVAGSQSIDERGLEFDTVW